MILVVKVKRQKLSKNIYSAISLFTGFCVSIRFYRCTIFDLPTDYSHTMLLWLGIRHELDTVRDKIREVFMIE